MIATRIAAIGKWSFCSILGMDIVVASSLVRFLEAGCRLC